MKHLLILVFLVGCNPLGGVRPPKETFQQNNLYCYKKVSGKWEIAGFREVCPKNTYYDLNSPN